MAKPDKFMLAHAPHVQEALEKLGGSWADIYVVTAAMSWDLDRDKPCLMYTVQVTEDEEGTQQAYAQVMYLDDVEWVPAERVQRLRKEAVENNLIEEQD